MQTFNTKDTGYRGIWYMCQPTPDEYVYKYSGGFATYCAKHQPFAVYCQAVHKTFFRYGGAAPNDNTRLWHMVSYYDHATDTVPRPTILLDKQTDDAHDNPVISVDENGYLWIFSTAHGVNRPSFIHRSVEPYTLDRFERVEPTRIADDDRPVPFDNFSYMQAWRVSGHGFACFMTRYHQPVHRTVGFIRSDDGVSWSQWQRLGAIEQGHYQISAHRDGKLATAMNFHTTESGIHERTNLYYMESTDLGRTWQAADGAPLDVPLTDRMNAALVHDFRTDGLLVYMKDLQLDEHGRPVILVLTSTGPGCGPANGPFTWTIARWTGGEWAIRPAITSDNNYDTGSLYLEDNGTWRIIGPTEPGPQAFNPGGEMAMWTSHDEGSTWRKVVDLTTNSPRNHTYARRPVNAHPGFYAFWADGHGREPSGSTLYFATKDGQVRILPREMSTDIATPDVCTVAV